MEIKTDGQVYQEVKDMFEQHGGIDYNNRCNIPRVRVDDIIKYLYQYKKDVDDYHSSDYFVKKFIDELSQSTPKIEIDLCKCKGKCVCDKPRLR